MSFVSGFSPSGDQFAVISSDGRLRVYSNTGSGLGDSSSLAQSFSDSERLGDAVTCMSWSVPSTDAASLEAPAEGLSASAKKKKRRVENEATAPSSSSSLFIAYGTEAGNLVIFSTLQGQILHILGPARSSKDAHTGRINALAWKDDGETLFSASADKHIFEWNARTGQCLSKWKADKHAVTSLAFHKQSNALLSAGRTLKLWDVVSKKEIKSFTGHENPITGISVLPTSQRLPLFVSLAGNERMLNVWDGDAQGAVGVSVALASLSAKKVTPVQVDAAVSGNRALVAALCNDASVKIWELSTAKKPAKSAVVTPVASIAFHGSGTDSSQSIPILSVAFLDRASSTGKLVVCRDTLLKPVFEVVSVLDGNNNFQESQVLAREVSSGLLLSKQKSDAPVATGQQQAVTMVASAPGASAFAAKDKKDKKDKSKQAKTATGDETTMEQKLRDLVLDAPSSAQASSGSASAVSSSAAPMSTNGSTRAPPQAHSLVQMLVQALHSNDNQLLEDCLSNTSEAVIRNTLKRLPASYVIPLLTIVVEKFQAKPSRGLMLITWIRSLLLIHTSYLMTVPNLVEALSGLYQLVDGRLAVFKKLLKLSGRLDLIISQIASRTQVDSDENEVDHELVRPRTVYQEDSEEEGELGGDSAMDAEDYDDDDSFGTGKSGRTNDANDDNDEEVEEYESGDDDDEDGDDGDDDDEDDDEDDDNSGEDEDGGDEDE